MPGDRGTWKRVVGILFVVVGPIGVVYGAAAMIGGAFGNGTDSWATALFIGGMLIVPLGMALIASARRR